MVSCCNHLEAEKFARILLASYPNSTPTDKEAYIAIVQAIFAQYEPELVRKAVAPSGIPFEIGKFLPTSGDIEKWLSGKKVHLDRISKMKALPLPVRQYIPPAPAEPNLFVGEDVPGYEDAVAFSKAADARFWRHEKDHTCYDGRLVNGYWIPNSWWESRRSKTYDQWQAGLSLREVN